MKYMAFAFAFLISLPCLGGPVDVTHMGDGLPIGTFGEPIYDVATPVDARPVDIDGEPFVAFDVNSAQILLQMRVDFPKLKLEIVKLKDQIDVRGQELAAALSANDNLVQQKDFLTNRIGDLEEQISNKDAWYRSPYLWFTCGLIVGVGATVAIVYAVNVD